MSDCLQKYATDPNIMNVVNRKILTSIIKDNYAVIVIFIILSVLLVLILYYFIKHLVTTLKNYKKYNRRLELAPAPTNNQYDIKADDEIYKKEEEEDIKENIDMPVKYQVKEDPMDYNPKGKKDFLKDVTSTYDDYNVLKSQYIKTTYNRYNDDVIDENILFSKHDDYDYIKKPENVEW